MENQGINTENPNHIEYEYSGINIAVLGGIRIDVLDRLKATLKLEIGYQVIRHTFDLYNDSQLDKFIRKVVERFEVSYNLLNQALLSLVDLLEKYRLAENAKLEEEQLPFIKHLTKEEHAQAVAFLKQPDLLARTNDLIGASGVVGEVLNRLRMYLIFTSRKMRNPLHVINFGSSGTGKSHLQEKVGALIPEEEKVEMTYLSENALYYFGQQELRNKVIIVEDLDGAESALYPLRELQSKKKLSKTIVVKTSTGDTKAVSLVVEGPVSVSGCTTKEKVYEDNANRCFLLYLDETEEQDARILDYQRQLSAGTVDEGKELTIREELKNVQRVLQPITIRNPYAVHLDIPKEVFKPRRSNSHYLAFIESITFYYQYQREKKYDKETGEEYIETTIEDIELANELVQDILLRKSDDLSGKTRDYYETLKSYLKQKGKHSFKFQEVRKALRLASTTMKRYQKELMENGYLFRSGKRSEGYDYELINAQDYEQLQNKIEHVLREQLVKIKSKSKDRK